MFAVREENVMPIAAGGIWSGIQARNALRKGAFPGLWRLEEEKTEQDCRTCSLCSQKRYTM
jgi:hypothetical protein